MKTIKTANGMKKIEDWDDHVLPIQLRKILQDHRSTLVNKMIGGGLSAYIDYKFGKKATPDEMEQVIAALDTLKQSGIDMDIYGTIFQTVEQNSFTSLGNALFYLEIDKTIQSMLFQPRPFTGSQPVLFQ